MTFNAFHVFFMVVEAEEIISLNMIKEESLKIIFENITNKYQKRA